MIFTSLCTWTKFKSNAKIESMWNWSFPCSKTHCCLPLCCSAIQQKKKNWSISKISFFQQGKHNFDEIEFSRRKISAWIKVTTTFSKAIPMAMPRSMRYFFIRQLNYHLWHTVYKFHTTPVRANRKHTASLCLSSFLASWFWLGQNYLSHLKTLWLSICRGKSGGSFHLISQNSIWTIMQLK